MRAEGRVQRSEIRSASKSRPFHKSASLPQLCILLSALCFLLCRRAHAAGEADAFALPGVGARPGGMGGAFIGLSDDIESIYSTPAGLGNLIQSGVTAMYQAPALETSRGFLGFNKRW